MDKASASASSVITAQAIAKVCKVSRDKSGADKGGSALGNAPTRAILSAPEMPAADSTAAAALPASTPTSM